MDAISEFERVVDSIYGVFLDATTGFVRLREWFENNQTKTIEILKSTHPELARIDYLDEQLMIYGKGEPDDPKKVILHQCTQQEYKNRNEEQGINYRFLGNMSSVALYQYWEDSYRSAIAKSLGKDKTELKSPIMGDLRRIRTSIIHHGGIALPEVETCEVLKWYNESDEIFVNTEKFEEIVYHVKLLLAELRRAS